MPVINVCPQCRNEEINPEDNFCKICGLNLLEIKAAVQVLIDKGVTPEEYELAYFDIVSHGHARL